MTSNRKIFEREIEEREKREKEREKESGLFVLSLKLNTWLLDMMMEGNRQSNW